MSRPKPTIICSHSDNNLIVEVCEADAVYAVLFQGQPIKVRKQNPEKLFQGIKYSKTSFPEPGHAMRLARKLNDTYNSTEFTVAIMSPGKVIYEE